MVAVLTMLKGRIFFVMMYILDLRGAERKNRNKEKKEAKMVIASGKMARKTNKTRRIRVFARRDWQLSSNATSHPYERVCPSTRPSVSSPFSKTAENDVLSQDHPRG